MVDRQPELAAGRRIIMALPATLSRDSRALWHKIVEGFREPVAMTAISNVGQPPHHAARRVTDEQPFVLVFSLSALLAKLNLSLSCDTRQLNLPLHRLSLGAWSHSCTHLCHVQCHNMQLVLCQGVGTGRHLQVLPAAGREGAHKGKPRVVSEQAKELWNWCQVSLHSSCTSQVYCPEGATFFTVHPRDEQRFA